MIPLWDGIAGISKKNCKTLVKLQKYPENIKTWLF